MCFQEVYGYQVIYFNFGDWVESLIVLEYKWGCWLIYEYDEMDYVFVNLKLWVKEAEQIVEMEEEIDLIGNISIEEIFQ